MYVDETSSAAQHGEGLGSGLSSKELCHSSFVAQYQLYSFCIPKPSELYTYSPYTSDIIQLEMSWPLSRSNWSHMGDALDVCGVKSCPNNAILLKTVARLTNKIFPAN